MNKCWERIRKAAGIERVRIHDLRRSFGSWLGDAGLTSKQIGTVLGHKTDITSRVYMALGDTSKREAVKTMQALLTAARRAKQGKTARKKSVTVKVSGRRRRAAA